MVAIGKLLLIRIGRCRLVHPAASEVLAHVEENGLADLEHLAVDVVKSEEGDNDGKADAGVRVILVILRGQGDEHDVGEDVGLARGLAACDHDSDYGVRE